DHRTVRRRKRKKLAPPTSSGVRSSADGSLLRPKLMSVLGARFWFPSNYCESHVRMPFQVPPNVSPTCKPCLAHPAIRGGRHVAWCNSLCCGVSCIAPASPHRLEATVQEHVPPVQRDIWRALCVITRRAVLVPTRS